MGQSSHGGAKKGTFRLFSDYQAVNSPVEQSPGVMPNQEDMRELLGAKCFGKLDLLQGYWQMPLAPEAQEVFTIVTPDGLFTPTRVPQEYSMRPHIFKVR